MDGYPARGTAGLLQDPCIATLHAHIGEHRIRCSAKIPEQTSSRMATSQAPCCQACIPTKAFIVHWRERPTPLPQIEHRTQLSPSLSISKVGNPKSSKCPDRKRVDLAGGGVIPGGCRSLSGTAM